MNVNLVNQMLVVLNIESMFKQVNNEHKDYVRKLKLLHCYFQLRYVVQSEDKISSYDRILHICQDPVFCISDLMRKFKMHNCYIQNVCYFVFFFLTILYF